MISKSWDVVFTVLVFSVIIGYFGSWYLNGVFDARLQLISAIKAVFMTAGACYFIMVLWVKVFGEGNEEGEFDDELDVY